MSMIDLERLPKEKRDFIELKEATDQTFSRFVDEDYTDILWNLLADRANPNVEHSFIASIYGQQGSGKSMAGIAMCCFLDPQFSADQIYFDYNDLVYNRHLLRPNSAVLIDEQSQSYGLDSHRVMIILASLKEQLRKKSIHFIFCSPTLYEESKSSMYLFETVYIDFETQECFAAMKTREGLTMGHVRVPYPLKELEDNTSLASKELIEAYQEKKDAHLEKVLGKQDVDIFEERARRVMEHKLFKKVEKIYKSRMGYIPNNTLIQVINKIFPEFNAGVVPGEIAGRIKLDKEISGNWEVSGRGVSRLDKRPVKRKRRKK